LGCKKRAKGTQEPCQLDPRGSPPGRARGRGPTQPSIAPPKNSCTLPRGMHEARHLNPRGMARRERGHRRLHLRPPRPRQRQPRRPNPGVLRKVGKRKPNSRPRVLPPRQLPLPHRKPHPKNPHQKRTEALAWAAGLFDGEGCIFIKYAKWQIYLGISLTHHATLAKFQRLLGGSVGVKRNLTQPTNKAAWIWTVQSLEAGQRVLEALYPNLVTKREEAKVALRFLRYRALHRHRGVRYSKQEVGRYAHAYWQLRQLKRASQTRSPAPSGFAPPLPRREAPNVAPRGAREQR